MQWRHHFTIPPFHFILQLSHPIHLLFNLISSLSHSPIYQPTFCHHTPIYSTSLFTQMYQVKEDWIMIMAVRLGLVSLFNKCNLYIDMDIFWPTISHRTSQIWCRYWGWSEVQFLHWAWNSRKFWRSPPSPQILSSLWAPPKWQDYYL